MRTLLLTLTTCLFVLPAYAKYSGGSGTAQDPYQIATAADLIALGETPADYDKHFILTADIDLDPNLPGGKVFDKAVIAADTDPTKEYFQGTPFAGVFEGKGHKISHVTILGGGYLGLFGQLGAKANVSNLGLEAVNIHGTGSYVGGVAGYNGGNITTSHSSGSVNGSSLVGGFVGGNAGDVTNCYSRCAVIGDSTVGGLIGSNGGSVKQCYSVGPVTGNSDVGGLVGRNTVPTFMGGTMVGAVTTCFWDTQTSGQFVSDGGTGLTTAEMQRAGTFLAWGASGSCWTIDEGLTYPHLVWENVPGQVIAGPTYGGGTGTVEAPYLIYTAEQLNTIGLVPSDWDKHFKLMADIDLSAETWPAPLIPQFSGVFDGNGHIISHLTIKGGGYLGLFGSLGSKAEVKDLGVVDVNIAGSGDYVGGIVGSSYGAITGCYSTGAVSGKDYLGGLVGSNGGTVSHCYSTGLVSGTGWSGGGLVGSTSLAGVVHGVWETQASGLSAGVFGVGLTTAEMMDPYMLGLNGFANDPNWVLDPGRDYPRLAWEGTPGAIVPEPDIDWLEGAGTAENPYVLDAAEALIPLGRASILWDKHFVLTADIDLDPNLVARPPFTQAVIPVFTGVFDGQGHAISNLMVEGGGGLFGYVLGANTEISNTRLTNPNVKGGGCVGGLAGWVDEATITNCHVTDPCVSGIREVGGLVGHQQKGTIADCSVVGGHVSGGDTVGGLAGSGLSYGGTLIRCSVNDVQVSGEGETFISMGDFGGLLGYAGGGTIDSCRVTGGVVRGNGAVGGLVGARAKGITAACCASTVVEAAQSWPYGLQAGGLVGRNYGTIQNCHATGKVSQQGETDRQTIYLGGHGVGGLVGVNMPIAAILQSYSTSIVIAADTNGGLVGNNRNGTITACFWDVQTSGQRTSAGGTGKTTAEMQTAKTFLDAGWDFVGETANGTADIWWLLEGKDYPRLWWEARN